MSLWRWRRLAMQEKIVWRRLGWMLTLKPRIFTSRKQPGAESSERMLNHVAIQERYSGPSGIMRDSAQFVVPAGIGMGIDPDWTAFQPTLPDQHILAQT